ncbi:hypothetical protein IJ843_06555 [bacterium]|nr:hypothetical protein [bacterium]
MGKDLFIFIYNKSTGLAPYRAENFTAYLSELKSQGETASGWIMDYDNMDYLKFTDSNGTCSGGSTVTETNPRCK